MIIDDLNNLGLNSITHSSNQKIQKDKWIKWYSANQNAALLHFIALKEPRKKTKWLQYSHGKITDYAID